MTADNLSDDALVELLVELRRYAYRFTTIGNPSHRRVVARPDKSRGVSLRDVFGWSLPFDPDEFDSGIMALLQRSGCLLEHAHGVCSAIRVSSIGDDLLIHSRWPSDRPDAVFFGPDTYRFAAFLRRQIGEMPTDPVVLDIGTGSGAGGMVAVRCAPQARVILSDINPQAVRFAQASLRAARVDADVRLASGFDAAPESIDLIVANPPFIAGHTGRTYRDGGDLHGSRLSLDWVQAGLPRLKAGGRLLMYTGATVIDGADEFLGALLDVVDPSYFKIAYEELDPDIFGSELSHPAYADAERIAAVGLCLTRRP